MDFKGLVGLDLDEVFFNKDEHGTELVIDDDIDNPIACNFDQNTEVIMDNGTEYGESAALVPSVLMKKADAERIEHEQHLHIEGDVYVLNFKKDEDLDTVRVYLEKRREA